MIEERQRKRSNITPFLLCVAGTAVNISLSSAVSKLGLPLYLDTIGTVAAAIMGGYLPGVLVGFMTNNVKSFIDPSALYYGVLNVLIGLCAAFLAERGWHKNTRGIIGMVTAFTLIGGGLGAIIPWFMEGLSYDGASLSGMLYSTGYFNLGAAHFLSSLLTDLPDKVITMVFVMIIIFLVPEKKYDHFKFYGWQQTPISEEEAFAADKTGIRVMSLQKKILLALGASLFLVSVVAIEVGVSVYSRALIDEHKRLAQGTARIAAGFLDGDKIDEYLETKGTTPDYDETLGRLAEIRKNSTDISYLYVYKIDEEGCHTVFDVSAGDYSADPLGTVIPFDEGFAEYVPDLLSGNEVEPIITDDTYGYLLTAYQPVYDSEGRCACYVGADVEMNRLRYLERRFFAEMISVFMSFFIMICSFVIWLAQYHFIIPIKSIMHGMDRLSRSSGTQESMDENFKIFRRIGIHTGDEVENLYYSASQMMKNQTEQLRSIRRLSDSTAKMQDGLILTMADLVESRDFDTGGHVQRTAAYVNIIVNGLKKKGYYAQKITPKFMSDVVRSAPLHDIGKINIPDDVLNKAGKLTDEEYAIMKSHTTEGKRIMETAISTIEGDNYLKEARNMAAYHHERWDGKGYPEGLHGEVIPLSARIMAVADVFDALSAPRIYKPAFPLEKVIGILEEGKGQQFDPKCVEVFLEAMPEVKVLLDKYTQEMQREAAHAK